MLRLLLVVACLSISAASAQQPKPGPIALPEPLKPFKATITDRKGRGPTLVLSGDRPLTAEERDAVATLPVRATAPNGSVRDDAGMNDSC